MSRPPDGNGDTAAVYGDSVRNTLLDLAEFGDMAERLVARGRNAYDEDETLRLAAEAILHRIGEAVSRLPVEFIDAHPEVEWRKMKATRNIVAHQYARIDHEMIWVGLVGEIPKTTAYIKDLLGE